MADKINDIDFTSTPFLIKEILDLKVGIEMCKQALFIGIKTYAGGSVQDKLDSYSKRLADIEAELKERKEQSDE
jgi:hypothetical protein